VSVQKMANFRSSYDITWLKFMVLTKQHLAVFMVIHRCVKHSKKIIINTFIMKNNKRSQTFIINVDIFQMVCKLCMKYFCSSYIFKIPVRAAVKQNSFPNSYYKINFRESLIVNYLVKFFCISCDVY